MAAFKVRFINSSGFVSDAIDWATNSLWDHAEIITESGTYIGAHDDGGVQERPVNYCTPTRERRYAIPCRDEQYEKAMAYARSRIGTSYDFTDIAGLLFHDRKLNDKRKDICSTFVLVSAMAGDIKMLNVEEGFAYLVTPEMLHLSPLLIGNCIYRFPAPPAA